MSGIFSSRTDKILVVALAMGGGLYTAQPQFPSGTDEAVVEEPAVVVDDAATVTVEPEVVEPEVIEPERPELVAPSVESISLDDEGLAISGTATAGAGVALISGDASLAETIADDNGRFSLSYTGDFPDPALSLETQFEGEDESLSTNIELPEPKIELVAPTIDALNFDEAGVDIRGVSSKSTTVQLRDAAGAVLAETAADDIGAFALRYDGEISPEGMDAVLASVKENGEEASTNLSLMPPVPEVVLVAPEVTENEVTDTSAMVKGKAAVGSSIELRDVAGTVVASSDVSENGEFALEMMHELPQGDTEMSLVSIAPSGEEMQTMITLTPPEPVIEPVAPVIGEMIVGEDGAFSVAGTAVAGTMVELRDEAGELLASAETSEEGAFIVELPEIPEMGVKGEMVNVAPSGAEMSTPIEIAPPEPEIVLSAPIAETLSVTDEGILQANGVAEGAVAVELRDAAGAVLARTDVGEDGRFKLKTAEAANPGELAGALVSIDENGEELASEVSIDVPERLPPVVAPTIDDVSYSDTGAVIKGMATADTMIELRLPSGNVVSETVVDEAGAFELNVNADIPATGMMGTLVSVNQRGEEAQSPLELVPPAVEEPVVETETVSENSVEAITIGLSGYTGAANEPVVLEGVTVPGATVEFIIDGQNVGSVEADSDGAYVGRVDGIPAGQYPIVIRSTTGTTSADINSLLEVDEAEAIVNQADTNISIMRSADDSTDEESSSEAETAPIEDAELDASETEESTEATEAVTEAPAEEVAAETAPAAEAADVSEVVESETNEAQSAIEEVVEDVEDAVETLENAGAAATDMVNVVAGSLKSGDISGIASMLDDDALEKYRALPELTSVGGDYEVKEGDSLEGISNELYGSIDYWPAIYALNAEEIGEDPHKIFPGQILKMP